MNILEDFMSIAPDVKGKSILQLFDRQQNGYFNWCDTPPGHCLRCSRKLEENEMFPENGGSPRAYCEDCWKFFNWGKCQVCQRDLPGEQIAALRRNPLDPYNRMHLTGYTDHENPCKDNFVIASAHILGIRTWVIEAEGWWDGSRDNRPPLRKIERVFFNMDTIL